MNLEWMMAITYYFLIIGIAYLIAGVTGVIRNIIRGIDGEGR